MHRLFFQLYLVLALFIAAFIAAAQFLPEVLLKDTIARDYERISKGTFALLLRQLEHRPVTEWPNRISSLKGFFGYPLALEPLEKLKASPGDKRRLHQGRLVYAESDGAQHWYQRIADGPYVLSIAMEQPRSEHAQRITMGTFYMVMQSLRQHPTTEWSGVIEQLQADFGFPLHLLQADTDELSSTERAKLKLGETVLLDDNEPTERYYIPVAHSDLVLKAGPIGQPLVVTALPYLVLGMLALTVALAAILWDRIQRLVESHRELTNAVSHELRTPISRLRFGLEMVTRTTDKASRNRYLAGMNADVNELDSLVSELLSFARLERATPNLQLQRQALVTWLANLIDEVQKPNTGAISVGFAPGLERTLAVTCEPRLMARAVRNLLTNALHYARRRVEVAVLIDGAHCTLMVDDDGPGIPVRERDRVFEPFTRLDPSRDKSSGGFGLGLAIVKRIADCHGGSIDVTDSPLGGARFRIRWPGCRNK